MVLEGVNSIWPVVVIGGGLSLVIRTAAWEQPPRPSA
jgi:hypothetical protein